MRSPTPTTIARSALTALALVALLRVTPSRAGGGGEEDPPATDVLGAIDFVPSRATLDDVMGPAPVQSLTQLATDFGADDGVRLRAIRGLAHYPTPEARTALAYVIEQLAFARSGTELLLLRAAIESLAEIGGADAVPLITPFLAAVGSTSGQGRDLRAAAANALRVIGSPTAVPALRDRQRTETVPQVSLAITEALRAILGGS